MRRILPVLLLAGCAAAPVYPSPRATVVLGSPHWKCDDAVTALAASPDGKRLVAGDLAGNLRLLDAASGAVLRNLSPHDRRVRALAFSPDGSLVASLGEDRRGVVHRAADGSKVGEVKSPEAGFYMFGAAAFSPDGRTVLFGGIDAGAVLMDVAKGGESARWDLQTWGVCGFAWSADGTQVAIACADGAIKVRDVATGADLRVLRSGKPAWTPYYAAAAILEGGAVAGVRHDGFVDRWEADGSGGTLREEKGAKFPGAVLSPDRSRFAVAARDGSLRWIDAKTGQETGRVAVSRRALLAVAFLSSSRVAVAGEDGAVRVLDEASGAVVAGPAGHVGPVYAISVSPDGNLVATGGRDGVLRLWEPGGKMLSQTAPGEGPIYALRFAADGRTPEVLPHVPGDPVPERASVLSPDGRTTWTATEGGTVLGTPMEPGWR